MNTKVSSMESEARSAAVFAASANAPLCPWTVYVYCWPFQALCRIATSLAAGIPPSVKFHQFRGALSGLMAALLAEQDFVTTRQFLTAPDGGFYPTYCGGGPKNAATARARRY